MVEQDADTAFAALESLEELAKRCLSSGKMLIGDDKAAEFRNKIKALK